MKIATKMIKMSEKPAPITPLVQKCFDAMEKQQAYDEWFDKAMKDILKD